MKTMIELGRVSRETKGPHVNLTPDDGIAPTFANAVGKLCVRATGLPAGFAFPAEQEYNSSVLELIGKTELCANEE